MKVLSLAGTCRVFGPWESINHLPKVLQEGESCLPVCPRDPYIMLCTPGSALSSAPQGQLYPLQDCAPQLQCGESHTLPKLHFKLKKLLRKTRTTTTTTTTTTTQKPKTWDICYFLLPSRWSRGVFFLCRLHVALSQPLDLSLLFFFPLKGFPPLHDTAVFLSPSSLPFTKLSVSQLWRSFCHSADQFPGCSK